MRRSAIAIYQFLRQHGTLTASQRVSQLLGRRCIGCGQSDRHSVCEACFATLNQSALRCRVCGLVLTGLSRDRRCGACLSNPPAYQRLHAVTDYAGWITEVVVAAKIVRNPNAVEAMRYLQRRALIHFDATTYADYTLLAMPIPKWRLLQRGFNLPLVLADDLVQRWQLSRLPSHAVTLPWYTPKQALMTRQQRRKRRFEFRLDDNINGNLPKKVLIVDDVVTTGTTVNALAKCLQRHGVKDIAVWTFARTQRD